MLSLFKEFLDKELPQINQAVAESITRIPASAQKIASHILNAGGKRLRPVLVVIFARLFGNNDDQIYRLASSMELLHAATLLHDDILDNASLRRNRQTAHEIYGNTKTILAGDAMLAAGNEIVAEFGDPHLVMAYSQATSETACGEILEMDSLRNPSLTEEEYLEIASGKTACLIAKACLMGAAAANADSSFRYAAESFGKNLGIAFQLVDDALDFAPNDQTGKPRGGDLAEGKMTPVLACYRASLSEPAKRYFDEKFRSNSFTHAEIAEILEKTGDFIPKVLKMAETFLDKARTDLACLPASNKKSLLYEVVDYVGNRTN